MNESVQLRSRFFLSENLDQFTFLEIWLMAYYDFAKECFLLLDKIEIKHLIKRYQRLTGERNPEYSGAKYTMKPE